MKMKTTYLFTIVTLFAVVFSSNAQTDNTFSGLNAGANSIGNFNTGFGVNSLSNNTSNANCAFGNSTLSFTTGGFNCAFGNGALSSNGDGRLNCAFGTSSLSNNDTGRGNIAIGHRTLEANVSGNNNTSIGYASLLINQGNNNIALGASSPRHLQSGDSNIFIGYETAINLFNGSNNVMIGSRIILPKTPSTPILAGNDTDKTVIIADGSGTQRIFIHKNGNTGIGLGDNIIPVNRLDVKGGVAIGRNFTPNGSTPGIVAPINGMLVEGKVGIGTTSPNNKVEITQGTDGNSGLRFTNLTSSFIPSSTQTSDKFLSVNAAGDVVLQKMTNNAVESNELSSNVNIMTSNVNAISSSAKIVNSISNSINANNQLITTVNGVASNPVNLPVSELTEVDGSITNELQTLSQSGNVVSLSNNGGSITLPSFTDTDSQSLTLAGNTLTISNGNSVTLPTYTDVPQILSQTGNTVTLSNGGGTFTLPTFTDTDGQSLTLTGNTLSISNGNSVTLPTYTDVPQTLSQTGNTVTLSNGGGTFTLPTFTDTDTDGQSLTLTGNTLSISNGNSVTLPTYTDVPQTLSQTGNTVTLSNGGGTFTLPTFTQVPQTISQTGNTVTLSNGGGTFTLPTFTDTDAQSLTLTGNTLSISNGNTVTLPTTNVVAGTNVTVTGNGSASTPFQVSAVDKSIYENNGTINQATTIGGNRIVYMNNSNLWFNGSSSESNGKVYIGSTATYPSTTGNYKLFVEGGILTEKVKVALRSTSNWADYVFEKDYNLMPLQKVEEYITANKHLPGIDSAAELSKEGLDLAEMQAKHMAKIEELTLYIIEQNKAILKNNKDIEELKKQIKVLTANED